MESLPQIVNSVIQDIKSYVSYRAIIKRNWPDLDYKLSNGPYKRYAENLYLFLNNLSTRPQCGFCKKELVYIDRTVGYGKFCSNKCSANSSDVKYKRKISLDSKTIEDKQNIITKRTNTMMNKYGVSYALQDPIILKSVIEKYKKLDQSIIQSKRKLTILQKYNVDNIWNSPDFRNNIKKTNIEKYKTEWGLQNSNVRNKCKSTNIQKFYDSLFTRVKFAIPLFTVDEFIDVSKKYKWKCKICSTEFMDHIDDGSDPQCYKCFPIGKNSSDGEREIVNYIKNDLMISNIIQNTSNVIFPKELDIWLPDYNVAIEFNGLYWHSEKKIKDKLYHQNKFLICEKLGITLIQIFSDEWEYNSTIVKNRIAHLLGKSSKICYARQCEIHVISKLEHDHFMKLYHIQGSCISKIRLGAFYKDNLVAVMSFGKNRAIYKSNDWELLRFATIGSIPGIASKLFKKFINNYQPFEIVSYCDIRWGTGKVYTELKMNNCGTTKPGYWYTKDGLTRQHRFSMAKHKLIKQGYDVSKTELEITKELGYYRIWDAGHKKFLWNK